MLRSRKTARQKNERTAKIKRHKLIKSRVNQSKEEILEYVTAEVALQ